MSRLSSGGARTASKSARACVVLLLPPVDDAPVQAGRAGVGVDADGLVQSVLGLGVAALLGEGARPGRCSPRGLRGGRDAGAQRLVGLGEAPEALRQRPSWSRAQ